MPKIENAVYGKPILLPPGGPARIGGAIAYPHISKNTVSFLVSFSDRS